jgi:hypothetical protein
MYTISIKNEKLSSFNKVGVFILLAHLLYFGYYFLKVNTNVNFIAPVAGIAVSFLGIALNLGSFSRNKQPAIPYWLLFILMSAAWAGLEQYLFCIAMILLGTFDLMIRKKPQFIFTDNNVEQKNFPSKIVEWAELNNVVLKDNILTIDFKNDKLIQAEIDVESYDVDDEEFNAYCLVNLQSENS